MIILFEGARCTGKTTLSRRLVRNLKEAGFPAEGWKAERGENPFDDMMETIHSDFSDTSKLWVADRFHLTEYVNSFADGRVPDKADLWRKTVLIDRLLSGGDVFLAFMMSSSAARLNRLEEEKREEPIGPAYMNALWVDTVRRSELPKIGIFSNTKMDLIQARRFLLTFAKAHWDKAHTIP